MDPSTDTNMDAKGEVLIDDAPRLLGKQAEGSGY
jgi:hypothetical protein